jgi:hypothetical protein
MWLYRGAQSAIFYYVTCTPCATTAELRRRKKEAVRHQREKAKHASVICDQPRVFPQPTPFSTNEGWKGEIELGPGPPARKGHRPVTNRTESRQTDPCLSSFSVTSNSTLGDDLPQRKEKGGIMPPLGERWNWMRYQREDEPLWGEELKGSSVGISGRGRASTINSGKYYHAKVPPVNDLHPPIVSGPTSRAETRWMLQPPPPAKVMAGKARCDSSARVSRDGSPRRSVNGRTSYGQSEDQNEEASWPGNSQVSEVFPRSRSSNKSSPLHLSVQAAEETHLTEPRDSSLRAVRRPPLATVASCPRSNSPSCRMHNDSRLNVLQSDTSRSTSSSNLSSISLLDCPETPYSRPGSKATDDSGKAFRSSFSNITTTLHHKHQDVQTLHLEINEQKLRRKGEEQLEHVRPWRWSFDM